MKLIRLAVVCCLLCFLPSCRNSDPAPPEAPTKTIDRDQLQRKLDSVLEWTYSNRHLDLEQHAAWQILHGVLAYSQDFEVQREKNGEGVPAVQHLLDGGYMNGWTTRPGEVFDAKTDQETRGLKVLVEGGSNTGQGHPDQWLAVLAQCHLPPEQKILVGGHAYTMSDWVNQVQWDIPRNLEQEYSWTLIGLTTYLATDAEWTAMDGETWSIERLMEIELEQELAASACGGTHRMIGIAMALNHHLEQHPDQELTGVWLEADKRVRETIQKAREFQNPNGSFSSNYFQRGGIAEDLARDLGATGHVLEFLALAMTREELEQPWVRRSADHLCGLFEKTREIPLECGALYHAAHGLVLYRQRIYGERSYRP